MVKHTECSIIYNALSFVSASQRSWDPVQSGRRQCSTCGHGRTLPSLGLRPASGREAVCQPFSTSRCCHWHCQRECCDWLWHQVNGRQSERYTVQLLDSLSCIRWKCHLFLDLKLNIYILKAVCFDCFSYQQIIFVLCRLLRSLIGLKRVIINAAHFLVMKNKEFYRFYQTEPFLETVRGFVLKLFKKQQDSGFWLSIQYACVLFLRMIDAQLKTLCLSEL